ncbi:hypothetical protein EDM68_03665 [Candidatus Uhrbacteria bacterium]|nr:MAG: hypothetical protein EDM68_03665 [Candidatus Uhrbacteria bacterium]
MPLQDAVQSFLRDRLALELHPGKIILKIVAAGIDFLGWTHFPHHRVLRTKTKQRVMKRMRQKPEEATLQSYLGMLGHGDAHALGREIRNAYWFFC